MEGVAVRHFSDEDWVNFVLEVLPPPQRLALEQHLRRGCSECEHSRKFWENTYKIAQRDRATQVPDELQRAGEEMFAVWRRKYVLPTRATRALPIFDSLLEPVPVGVR